MFETWTGGYLGEHTKPVVLLNANGFYDGLFHWIDELSERTIVPRAARDRLIVATDLPTAFAALEPAAPAQ